MIFFGDKKQEDEYVPIRPLVLCIVQTKFTQTNWQLLELEKFSKNCDVLVLDLSQLLSRRYREALKRIEYLGDELFTPSSWIDIFRFLRRIRNEAKGRRVMVIYGVVPFSFKSYFFNLLFIFGVKNKCAGTVKLWNGGILIPSSNSFPTRSERLKKRILTISSYQEYLTHFFAKVFDVIATNSTAAYTHILVAGSDWEATLNRNLKRHLSTGCKVIKGHSWDYSNYLDCKEAPCTVTIDEPHKAVYLDTGSPMFVGDSQFSNRKIYYTVDRWYPALCDTFDKIELLNNCKVEIASHYKARHPDSPDYFGYRKVIEGKTMKLIERARLVIAVNSTAISFAVAMKKPLILIFSNQLSLNLQTMRDFSEIANTLELKAINIDDHEQKNIVINKISKDAYKTYLMRCLTSRPESKLSNSSLLMSEILNLPTELSDK